MWNDVMDFWKDKNCYFDAKKSDKMNCNCLNLSNQKIGELFWQISVFRAFEVKKPNPD